ncbi:MAG: deoxyribose-phosphate aldolase [Bacilli bacterium]|nr:deoxyribose-phosphate aldolase [Bacilli bacterium]
MNEYIDSTLLRSDATIDDITKLCEDAMKYHFASVCVNPYYVPLAKSLLEDSTVEVCTVIGFPLGANTTNVKVYEAVEALENGADEIDMVINIGALKDKEYDYVKREIEEVRNVLDGKVLKVIIETCYLSDDEIIKMTEICNETFVNFIKTSTGYGSRGASIEDIKIINEHKNEVLEVKASGGIKTKADAEKYIKLGVTRIGTSNAVKMMEE